MKHLKMYEQWDPENMGSSPEKVTNKTTVSEFMNWYAGPDWYEDWQTTNVMDVADSHGEHAHAQDDGEEGMSHLRDLKAAETEEIDVTCEDYGNAWDCSFTLPSNGKTYTVQSVDPFPEKSF